MSSVPPHTPVLLAEVLSLLDPKPGEIVCDATVGLGGHARAFLERIGPSGHLIGIDADAQNLREAERQLAPWKSQIHLLHGNFRNLSHLLTSVPSVPFSPLVPSTHIDILFADLGLSSPHIDDPSRGFTFRADATLDLRFDRTNGLSASTLLQHISTRELIQVFSAYGELPRSRSLAEAVAREKPSTTAALRTTVEMVYGWRAPQLLPQVFQALRIAVNDELAALKEFLQEGPYLLAPSGRMGIICYHSLEDRMVKHTFRALTSPLCSPVFVLLTRRALRPSVGEIDENPRARSARFRAIQRSPSP